MQNENSTYSEKHITFDKRRSTGLCKRIINANCYVNNNNNTIVARESRRRDGYIITLWIHNTIRYTMITRQL
jgi:hypothetical protein